MRRSRWWFLLALVVTLAALAAGCGGDDEAGEGEAGGGETAAATDTEAAEPVECSATIGIMGPFTGDVAAIGQEQLNWAKFAVANFNEENGTDFTLFEGDDQLDPAQSSTLAPQFVSNSDIVAVVGPAGSQNVEAVGEIFSRESLAFVSSSATATDLTERFDSFFRVVPTDADQGPTDAQYMIDELGAQKVLIIDDQSSYSTGLADSTATALEDGGVTVEREW
jgi:branched-chain amino acid transport system substrate-binding protein